MENTLNMLDIFGILGLGLKWGTVDRGSGTLGLNPKTKGFHLKAKVQAYLDVHKIQ